MPPPSPPALPNFSAFLGVTTPLPHGRPCLRGGRYPQMAMVDHVFEGGATPKWPWSTMSSRGALPPNGHGRPCLRGGRYPQMAMANHVSEGGATPKCHGRPCLRGGRYPQMPWSTMSSRGSPPRKIPKEWHTSPLCYAPQQNAIDLHRALDSNPLTFRPVRGTGEAVAILTIPPSQLLGASRYSPNRAQPKRLRP